MKHKRSFPILTLILLVSLSICFIQPVIAAETKTLEPITDSSIQKLHPDSNFGDFWKLQVSAATAAPGEIRAYIMFDLKEIPGAIQSAEFSLFRCNLTETHTIEVHFCSDNTWTETGITWNNAPSFAEKTIGSISVTEVLNWYSLDVTSDVKTAFGTAGRKLTVVLVSTTTTEAGYVGFYSRDGIGGLRPKIDITYEAAPSGLPITLLIQVVALISILIGAGALTYFKFLKKPPIEKPPIEKPPTKAVETPALIEGSRAAVMFHYVSGIMTKDVETVEPSKTVSDATKLMSERDIGYLVVSKNREPIGIITERDAYRRVIAKNLNPAKIKVEEVMSKPLITLSPGDAIEDTAKLMVTHNIGKLPIVEGSKLVGIVSETDLIRTLWNLLFLLP